MDSDGEDSCAGIPNGSLGREVMQVVQKNDRQEPVRSKVNLLYCQRQIHFIIYFYLRVFITPIKTLTLKLIRLKHLLTHQILQWA